MARSHSDADAVSRLVEASHALAEMHPRTRRKVLALKAWLRDELGAPPLDEAHLLRVLRLRRMNAHAAQRHLLKHHRLRAGVGGCAEIFGERRAESEEILTNCQNVYMVSIPRLTAEGHRINYIKLSNTATLENFDPKATFKRFFMISDIRFKEDVDCNGDVFLIDLAGFSYSHALKVFNSGLLNKFIKALKDTYPRKLVAIHFINAKCWHKKAINVSLKMSKAGKKIYKKIGTHTEDSEGIEGLETSTDKALQMFQDHNDLWTKKLISYSSWFEQQEAAYKSFAPSKKVKKSLEDYETADKSEKVNEGCGKEEVFKYLQLDGAFRQMELDDNEQR